MTRLMTSSSYSLVCVRRRKYPGSFDEFGVEDFLPAMQTLHVSPIMKVAGDSFPIFGSKFID